MPSEIVSPDEFEQHQDAPTSEHSDDLGRSGCTRPDRLWAATIDSTIAMLIVISVAAAVSANVPSSKNVGVNVALGIGVGAVYSLYFLVFEAWTSSTPGKFMLGLHVEHLDGSRCTFRAAFARTATRLIEVCPFIGFEVAAIVVRCSKRRQRWGDILAGTIVTDEPPHSTDGTNI